MKREKTKNFNKNIFQVPETAMISKKEMYKQLSNKIVECIYIEDKEEVYCGIFAVRDLENNKMFILDQIIENK